MDYDILYMNYRMKTCRGTTKKGTRCKKNVTGTFCNIHKPEINSGISITKECAICFDDIGHNDSCLECGHIFHKECLSRMKSNKCPLCRKESNILSLNLQKIKNRTDKLIDKLFYSNTMIDFIIQINEWTRNIDTTFLSHIIILRNISKCKEIIDREINSNKSDLEILNIIKDELKNNFIIENYTNLFITSNYMYTIMS